MNQHEMRPTAARAIRELLADEVSREPARAAVRRRRLLAFATTAASAAVVGVAVVGLSTTPTDPKPSTTEAASTPGLSFVDGPSFSSVSDLCERAEIVVEGTFEGLVGRADEGELNGSEVSTLDFELWGFAVEKVISGVTPGGHLTVSQVERPLDGAARPASDGRRAILFLKQYPNGTYAIVGLGNGALLVGSDGSVSTVPEATSELAASVQHFDEEDVVASVRASCRG